MKGKEKLKKSYRTEKILINNIKLVNKNNKVKNSHQKMFKTNQKLSYKDPEGNLELLKFKLN